MTKPRVAVVLPTRGLPFSETIAEVIRELKSVNCEWDLFWSHGKPVFTAFNGPTEKALKDKRNFTHLWHVDDDMQLPRGVLKKLLAADAHAIACDYPVGDLRMGSVMYDHEGKAFFTGAGCLLVKREVYEGMKRPIWRTDVGWRLYMRPDYVEFEAGSQNPDKVYGQQDVNFGLRLYTKGTPIKVLDVECGHRKLLQFGDKNSNSGTHEWMTLNNLHRSVYYIHDKPHSPFHQPELEMMTVVLKDGTITKVTPAHAERLFKSGVAERIGFALFSNWDFINEEVLA